MISDNFVTGDNIYLRELQNFFFETLGIMSITHYGAVGDGRVDNYGPLQVAIDDANRRHLQYLYVPYGRFIYAGNLINMENVTFVGNPHSKIVNIRTEEEIPIEQFGVNSTVPYNYEDSLNKPKINGVYLYGNKSGADLNLQDKLTAGSNVQINGTTISATDTKYTAGANVSISGGNVISATDTKYTAGDNITIDANNVISSTATGGVSDYTDLENKPSINNVTLSGNKTTADLGIVIPTKTSELDNDSGFIDSYTETDPTVPAEVKAITTTDISNWNGKYDLPTGGIPATDLDTSVQTSLGLADTAIQDVSDKEDVANKVTSISSSSTDTEYPSAKAVYDFSPNLPRFAYTLENATGNKSANAWYDMTNEYLTGVIPAGVYLMFNSFHLTSSNSNGVVTGKILLDAAEPEPHVRNTAPVSGNGTVAGSFVNIITFSAAATHTLKFQGWGSTSWSVSASSANVSQVVFVKIGEYIAPSP